MSLRIKQKQVHVQFLPSKERSLIKDSGLPLESYRWDLLIYLLLFPSFKLFLLPKTADMQRVTKPSVANSRGRSRHRCSGLFLPVSFFFFSRELIQLQLTDPVPSVPLASGITTVPNLYSFFPHLCSLGKAYEHLVVILKIRSTLSDCQLPSVS